MILQNLFANDKRLQVLTTKYIKVDLKVDLIWEVWSESWQSVMAFLYAARQAGSNSDAEYERTR